MAQDAGRIYRAEGGRYCGSRTGAQASLRRWTAEEWRTESGRPACERVTRAGTCADRYLPAAAWERLTPAERRATQAAKRQAAGQFSRNAPAAREAARKARR